MKKIIDFLLSMRTAIWLLCLIVVFFLAGAFIMPVRGEFQSIHSVPLFVWMREQPLAATWWLWGAVVALCVLTANTFFCSVESVIKKRKVTQWMLLVSPQIIHIGFLFMVLAHLASSLGGFKVYGAAMEGTLVEMSEGAVLEIGEIRISVDPNGYLTDWAVDGEYRSDGGEAGKTTLLPNKPFFREGIGVYVRDLRAFPNKAVLLEVSREPGAIWALIGGILFTVGTVALLILKMRREQ